ncbi:MAG: threonine-phosphate decarboxylase CobD [Eggerthellaceae bacterium]|nr:threonine-phosphate decarboxylase CobD [Eggerthellaceae bacterium]
MLDHGGDIQGFVDEFGYEPLDFSANVSPLGLPDEVVKAIEGCIAGLAAYPDPLCRKLTCALGAHHGIDPTHILCGNGCSDLIYRIARVLEPKRALLAAPTFSEYATALSQVNCDIKRHYLAPGTGYALDESFIAAITDDIDVVFICQPNNPCGLVTPRDVVERALARCNEIDAWLIVDECFIEFIDDPSATTMESHIADSEKLIILKAFTKLYGMAGLRLGYLLGTDAALIDRLRNAEQPWAVSTVAQTAGIAALSSTGYVEKLRELVQAERAFMKEKLAQLGIRAQGEANYLFFELNDGGELVSHLRHHGILIRDCSNFPGLGVGSYRVAILSHEKNEKLIAALADALQEK